jgi:hypothetical protein
MDFTLDAADKTEPPKDRAIAPEVIRAADLLVIARARLVALPGLRIDVDDPPPDLWLRVDSFVLVQALVALVERVSNDYTISRFRLRACRSGQLVALDVAWDGTVMGHDVLLAWQDETLYASGRHCEPPCDRPRRCSFTARCSLASRGARSCTGCWSAIRSPCAG